MLVVQLFHDVINLCGEEASIADKTFLAKEVGFYSIYYI